MYAGTLSFAAVVRNPAPLTCFGAPHLCSATMFGWSAPLFVGWVFTSRVCDLCRVRVDVRLSHPRPSVVTLPVYRGCPAGTHWGDPVSRVRPDQSANSCCACWCVVVRRTRCRALSVESPVLTFVGFPVAPLLDMVMAVALSIFGEASHHRWLIAHAVTTDLQSTFGWTFCWLRLRHELLCMSSSCRRLFGCECCNSFAVLSSRAHVAVLDRALISVHLPLVLILLALQHIGPLRHAVMSIIISNQLAVPTETRQALSFRFG